MNSSSADLVGQRIRDAITNRIQADALAGLSLATDIHNHPFLFDRKVGDRMWTLEATRKTSPKRSRPALPDVQSHLVATALALQEAWAHAWAPHVRALRLRETDAPTAR